MTDNTITALCLLNVYFWADLAFPGVKTEAERKALLRKLHDAGELLHVTGDNLESSHHFVASRYTIMIEAYVTERMPEGWEPTFDRYGARCVAYKPGFFAPTSRTFFDGDTAGHYMSFASAQALHDYTSDCLHEIKENEAC